MILFKTPRQQAEFDTIDSRLRIIIYAIDGFVNYKFQDTKTRLPVEITITDLFRTQSEQDEIYKNDLNYQIKPWKSVHQYRRGADIRIWEFNKSQQDDLLNFLNVFFTYYSDHPTALIHQVDNNGLHMHIQVDSNSFTEIKKI